jgi:hypothetical protein
MEGLIKIQKALGQVTLRMKVSRWVINLKADQRNIRSGQSSHKVFLSSGCLSYSEVRFAPGSREKRHSASKALYGEQTLPFISM